MNSQMNEFNPGLSSRLCAFVCSRRWLVGSGVEPGADQAGHLENLPPPVHLPAGQREKLTPPRGNDVFKEDLSHKMKKKTLCSIVFIISLLPVRAGPIMMCCTAFWERTLVTGRTSVT